MQARLGRELAGGIPLSFLFVSGETETTATAILEQAPEGILFYEATDEELVFCNHAAEQHLGCLPTAQTFLEPARRALRGEHVHGLEMEFNGPGGHHSVISVDAAPVDHGALHGAVVMLRDISSIKDAERLRAEFAAGIAHDLRNPLQAILLRLQLLLSDESEPFVSVPMSTIKMLQRRTERLAQMVTELLDASTHELQRVVLDCEVLALAPALEELVEQISPTLRGHRVEIVCSEALRVWADPARLDAILTNLLENAAKYSEPESTIVVHAAVELEGVRITVRDRGAGISADELPHLFDRFYQTRSARQRKSGVGLGLYITRRLVEAHGGHIYALSTPGEGSSFHVWLPARQL